MKDLIILAACKNTQFAVKGVLSRPKSLQLREITYDVFVHPERDPGCAKAGVDFLRSQSKRYGHALVIFDYEGSGVVTVDPTTLANSIRQSLSASGWNDRANVVVINPELEIWVWSDSPEVDQILGWGGRIPTLRTWLKEQGFFTDASQIKPGRPKEAVEAALFEVNAKRSSALYLELAQRLSLRRCVDPSFLSFVSTLRQWFGTVTSS